MKKHPSLFIVAIAAISIQCSIANNNLPPSPDPGQAPPTDEPINEEIQETIDPSIKNSPLIKIIKEMEAYLEDIEIGAELVLSEQHINNISETLENKKSFLNTINQHTTDLLLKKESINDYLFFLLKERALYIQGRYENITIHTQKVADVLVQPTSLRFFKLANDTFYKALEADKNDTYAKEALRFNKRIRTITTSWYELIQLLIKETLLLCNIESLDKKTIDILRASPSLHAFITNPDEEDLGHPDGVIAPYHILESVLLGYPKPIKDNKQLQNINQEITTIKKEIGFEKFKKSKIFINNKSQSIRTLINLLFSKDITNSRILNSTNYLCKDLDGEMIRNHFNPNEDTWELDKKSNYVQSKWPYPLPKPTFLEKTIVKYGPDPMPTKVIKSKPNVQHRKPLSHPKKNQIQRLDVQRLKNKKQRPGKRTTIATLTNVAPKTNQELEEKALESIEIYSQHVEDPTSLPSSTLTNLEPPTDETVEKIDIRIIPSQLLQEKDLGSMESLSQVEDPISLSSLTLTNPESLTDAAFEKTDTGIIPGQPLQEKEPNSMEAFPTVEDPTSLPSITLTNPQLPIDEILDKTDIEDYLIYYGDYNEYKNPKNYENQKLINDPEKNITKPEEEPWKQPAGARRFNSHLLTTRKTDFIITTHQETVNKIFDPKRQCKVKFREFVTLWESINGTITGSLHGGSHRKITAPDGVVLTGIFTHGNGTMYGKKSIQYLKMALEYVGLQPTE